MRKLLVLLAILPVFAFGQVAHKTLEFYMLPENIEPYPGVFQYFGEYGPGKFGFAWSLNQTLYGDVLGHVETSHTEKGEGQVYIATLNGPVIEEITIKQFLQDYKKKLREELIEVLSAIDDLKNLDDKDVESKEELNQLKDRAKELKRNHKRYVKDLEKDLNHRRSQGSIFVHNVDYYIEDANTTANSNSSGGRGSAKKGKTRSSGKTTNRTW